MCAIIPIIIHIGGVTMEYILYCDESSSEGKYYGDFFGGCLVSSKDAVKINRILEQKKQQLNLSGEIKWTKVTANYLEKYNEIIDVFFDFIKAGKIKVRIMFRDINDLPSQFERNENDEKYFKLYYQFIKHAFGFRFMPFSNEDIFLRIYLDQLPDKKQKCDKFKSFLRAIPSLKEFEHFHGHLHIREGDIAEVCSHDHVLLQCTDIVLGAMFFRLNKLHLEKPVGSRVRGKRTIAKEHLYKHINARIREILPNFNIGISTGSRNYQNAYWELPYSHWKFIPN